MFNGYFALSIIAAVAFIVLGFFAIYNKKATALNKLFLAFCVFTAAWLLTNFFASTLEASQSLALISNHLVLFFGCLSLFVLLGFVVELTGKKPKNVWPYILTINVAVAILSLTQLVIVNVFPSTTTYGIEFGPLALLYFGVLFADAFMIVYLLIRSRKTATGVLRGQIDTLLISLAVALVGILVMNAVLPILGIYGATNLGSFFIVFVVGGMAYGIIRHGLFDVRLVVARTLGYVLSLALFVITTLVLIYTIFSSDVSESWSQNVRALVFAIAVVLLASLYQPLKRLFDRVTNRLFFRDAYDTQALLDELNQTLVSTIDLQTLLTNTSAILKKYLKADFAAFALRQGEEDELRFIAAENFNKQSDISSHRTLLLDHGHKVLVTNLLDSEQQELKKFLFNEHIDVLARLTADPQVEGVGYLLIGEKKSGNPYTSQDIGVIDIVGNELVIAIQNALQFEEIQRFNVTLQEKIDTATRQLKKSNEKLKALDETKDEFISMASHQLRTPLTSVKGYLSMVLEGDAGKINDNQRKLLGQAFISSQRMVFLIADLLNVSRLKTGKFIIEPLPTNLADVVESEVEQLQETAASRELTLSFNKPENFPRLMLDETKTRQVVMNFMDNAVHYTPAGGHIKVFLEDKGSTIEYRVEDDGIGVPKSEQHHLFTKFYRANNAQKARPDGTGLGLFMAKKVIVAQNGSIIFKSQKDKGSTFGFSFSKDKLPALPAQNTDQSD